MLSNTRLLAVVVGVVAFAAPARAQNLAVYGAAEAAGLGESSAILGAALTPGNLGLNWLVGANVQTYRFITSRSPMTYDQHVAFTPSVGLQFKTPVGAVQGTVGYNFTSGNISSASNGLGVSGGGVNSPVIGAQANYWGDPFEHEAIVSLATKNTYLWSRLRLGVRPVPLVPVYIGGEFVYQGASDLGHRMQAGPTINFHVTPNFHFGVNGGVRWNDAAPGATALPKSGYVGVSFVALSAF
ncbi:MAG: hypothetical protein JWN53_209 [Gemmatimonadetes bacterium]|nr:hypothetical protein [Gemmatimonadota bacterium]